MPTPTHLKNRERCCLICFNERGIKPKRLISPALADVVCSFLLPTFTLSDFSFLIGICPGCNTAVDKLKHGKVDSIYTSEHLGPAKVPRTASNETKCSCIICTRGSLNGPEWKLFALEWNKKRNGNVKNNSDEHSLCPNCLSEVNVLSNNRDNKKCDSRNFDVKCFVEKSRL